MLLKATTSLHYPITIHEIFKSRDEDITRSTPLLSYFYKSTVTEGDVRTGEEKTYKKEFSARIDSPVDGKIKRWKVKAGDVIEKAGVVLADIEEPCLHEVQYAGLCADCGKDMTSRDYTTTIPDSARATIQKVHGHTGLTISQSAAERLEQDEKKRLVNSKKLSLVVDLDQTIIHATCEPTVAEWQNDPSNPNHDAVKDVRKFELVDDGPSGRGCWYYIKFRPGLSKFLENLSKLYEMHVYTAGTRAYARNVAKLLDPDRKLFGDRILSRDESGNASAKSLARLFPVSTKMVVVIDDRVDIWQFSEHVIKVSPYNFFPNTGDINYPFLPKTQLVTRELKAAPPPIIEEEQEKATDEATPETGSTNGTSGQAEDMVVDEKEDDAIAKIGQQLISMGTANDPGLMQEQESKQDEIITHQIEDRPLLQKQLQLDKAEEEAELAEREEAAKNPGAPEPTPHRRVPLLHDDDTELEFLGQHLTEIHRNFFSEYEQSMAASTGGRLADLKGAGSKKLPINDDSILPDVKDVITLLKRQVLADVHIVFTGVIPQNYDPQMHDLGRWAKDFGAQISSNLTKRTTHVIAAPERRTVKVKRAARHPHIKIVNKSWLFQCIQEWEHVDEEPHRIIVEQDDIRGAGSRMDTLSFDDLQDPEFLSTEDEGTNFTGDEMDDNTPAETDEDPTANLDDADWDALQAEIDAELDGSDDDSERSGTESEASEAGNTNGIKRKRASTTSSAEPSDVEDSDTGSTTGSKLQRRKRRAYNRISSLTNMTVADTKSGLPSPDTTGPEAEESVEAQDDGDIDDDDLEAEMLREMEADSDEDA